MRGLCSFSALWWTVAMPTFLIQTCIGVLSCGRNECPFKNLAILRFLAYCQAFTLFVTQPNAFLKQ